MEQEKNKKLRFTGPVVTRRIKGWKGSVHFVSIGLSVAVLGLVLFNILFLLGRVELPTEIAPAKIGGLKVQAEVVDAPPRKDITEYAPIASRNIFSPDRKEWEGLHQVAQQPTERELDETLSDESGLSLLGIVIAGEVKKALIKGKGDTTFLEEGEEIDGYKLFSIEPKRAYLSLNGREFTIGLYKDLSGLSGESPSRKEKDAEELELEDWLADWGGFPELYQLEDEQGH
ncbi:MAG: hypothetical protein ACE5KK_01500 [Candidatus Brocadiales bacterium]